MKNPRLCLLLTGMLCCVISGCGEITVGPRTETRYVIVKPGQPVRILQNMKVRGERMDGAGVAEIDVGGWVAMPPEHWAVIETQLNKDQ